MSSFCEIIRNLRNPKAPSKLSTFISGFVRKIISKFHGALLVFRRSKATVPMSTNPVDEDLNLGLLHEADHKEEQYEASTSPIPMKQQKGTKAEVTPICPNTQALVVEQVKKDDYCQHCSKIGDHKTAMCPNKPKRGLMFCTVCRHIYPKFCKKPEEHGNKAEDYIFCRHCYTIGDHETAMCPNKPKKRVMVCSVCSDLYPCKNQEEHGNKGVEVNNFCSQCSKKGHLPQECTEEYDPTLTLND
ncbi:uncharacterized protein LOC121049100 [Rosa chinensis]|uniref:uncharacterized protein LOC121049100 n=1 Tax=Rosa chinensis TaxID=74649 RepID=UPI001AD8E425|nr:uncharacterized protein LOC121049100 [Rosa chinensis]